MITYSSIALKDDKAFINIAKQVLRGGFDLAISDASEAFQSAYSSEPNKLKRVNAARRAANLVILEALKEFGVTNWRELIKDKNARPQRKVQNVTDSGVKPRAKKWEGLSIIEMAEKSKGKK